MTDTKIVLITGASRGIGRAAAMMLLGAGRIAGVSGIAARATRLADGDLAMTRASPA